MAEFGQGPRPSGTVEADPVGFGSVTPFSIWHLGCVLILRMHVSWTLNLSAWALGPALAALSVPSRAGGPMGSGPSSSTSQSVVLAARPSTQAEPSFVSDLDTYFMSDDIIDQMEDRYYMRLQEFSLQQGYIIHTRDSRLQRNYIGSASDEQAVDREMADSMKRYMLERGLPRYLSSHKQTRAIGETYTKAVAIAKSIGTIQVRQDNAWQLKAGVNPFTKKLWINYSNKNNKIELYNFFMFPKVWLNNYGHPNAFGVTAYHEMGRYVPNVQYSIFEKTLQTGVQFHCSRTLDSDFKTIFPLYANTSIRNVITQVSATYRF